MRAPVLSALGLIGGFVVGIVLFESGPSIELLPIVLALACAVAAPLVDSRLRWRSR